MAREEVEKDFMLYAIEIDCDVLSYASNKLLNDKEFMLQAIEENIGFILKKMQNAKIEAVKEQLNYNPTTVLNKIGDTTTLLVKVKAYNSVYYQMVENCVKKFKRTKIFDSDLFCKQIKRLFEDLEYLKDKEIIFNALVDWLVIKTQSDTKSTAEIIVSYFIQHCEAFRESAG